MEWQLKLEVGPEGVEIDTVPQVMANASPVFRRMLHPDHFAEGQNLSKSESLVVRLPEDDVPAMTILCDIIHHRNKVPMKDVTSDTVTDIATLVDKYDCAAAIELWAKLWFRILDKQELKSPSELGLGEVTKWIHISCHLGFAEQFNQFTSTLILRASQEDLGPSPLFSGYRKLSPIVQGRGFTLGRYITWLLTKVESIEKARNAGISSYYQLCFNLIEDLKEGNSCKFRGCPEELAFACSSMALGRAFLAAKELCVGGSWELLENWTGSIDYYHQRMKGFWEKLGISVPLALLAMIFSGPIPVLHHCLEPERQKLEAEIHKIYESCNVGLRLEVAGNHFYRTSDSSKDEPKE